MASEFEQLGFILDDMFDVPEPCVDDSAESHMMTLFDTNVELDSWNPLIGASSFTGAWDAAEPAGTHNGERFDASPCGVMETSALAPAVEDFETVTKDSKKASRTQTSRGGTRGGKRKRGSTRAPKGAIGKLPRPCTSARPTLFQSRRSPIDFRPELTRMCVAVCRLSTCQGAVRSQRPVHAVHAPRG